MFLETEMLKDKMFTSGADTTRPTRDGELPMLTSTERKPVKDSTEITDSISIEPSISDQMPMQRIAERVGSDVRLRRYRNKQLSQQFFFDIKSKTIKSQNSKSWSLEIPNQGRNSQLRMTTTNSRWW
jgi:hypothetical protein